MTDLIRSGVTDIDFTHLVMLNLAHRIERSLARKNRDMLTGNLDAFIVTTRNHFEAEERALKLVQYPDLEDHTQHHYLFVEMLFAYRDMVFREHDWIILTTGWRTIEEEMVAHINEKDPHATTYLRSEKEKQAEKQNPLPAKLSAFKAMLKRKPQT